MKERNFGIDLLRLVLMYMVCILHVLGQGGVLHAATCGTTGYYAFWLLEIMAYSAVDAFALITGYTATARPQKYEKLSNMWFQVFFYSFILSLFLTAVGACEELTIGDWLRLAMPITFNVFWYFTAYTALFFAMPILNPYLFGTDEKTAKKAIFLLLLLFSGQGVLTDPYRTQMGYSALWLIVLYCIGVLTKRVRLLEGIKSRKLFLLWVVLIAITWAEKTILRIGLLTEYISPTILLSGLIMVELFSRIRMSGKYISKLSPMAFGIYLFQCNEIVWERLYNAFAFITSFSVVKGLVSVLLLALTIFAMGLTVGFFRIKLEQLLQIQKLSQRIVRETQQTLDKLCRLKNNNEGEVMHE